MHRAPRAPCRPWRLLVSHSLQPITVMLAATRVLNAFTAMLVLLGACTQEVIYRQVDPSVDYGDEEGLLLTGDPEVELGFYSEQLYRPLSHGDDCPIVRGLQGGTWTMPAVRIRGIGSPAVVACRLVSANGEVLGQTNARERLVRTPDGWLELQTYPVPVQHAAPLEAAPISDLFGAAATLSCSATDNAQRTSSSQVRVMLREG